MVTVSPPAACEYTTLTFAVKSLATTATVWTAGDGVYCTEFAVTVAPLIV
jgi:hypothetical protein